LKAKNFDIVAIETKDKKDYKGLVMPSSDNKKIVLKLDSGYNIGILKSNIKSLKTKKKSVKQKQINTKKIKTNKNLPTISILHTGGTIASEVDYETGGVIARFTPEELIAMFPELLQIANIKSKLIANMFSEDINFSHYNLIAKEIEREIKSGVKGIIITHGTDTLHYTAAALSFILEDLNTPVIFVGAQRSSDRASSDAGMNLICAANFIAKTDFSEVGICMHEKIEDQTCLILPSCRTRKLHSSRRDAFKVIHGKPFARVFYKKDKIDILDNKFIKKAKRKLKLKLFKENIKVGILKAYPNMLTSTFKPYESYKGLILEGYGIAGNFPINNTDKYTKENTKIHKEIKKLAKKIPIITTTQTIFGRINQNVYSTGRKLKELGVLGNLLDITTETAYIKLAWLLSNHPKQVNKLFSENLRGELTKRTTPEEHFDF